MCESRIANAEKLLECSLAGDNVDPKETYFPLLDAVSSLGHNHRSSCYLAGKKPYGYDICDKEHSSTQGTNIRTACSLSSWLMPGKKYDTGSYIDEREFEDFNERWYNVNNYHKLNKYEPANQRDIPGKNPYSNKLGYSIAYDSKRASPNLNREKPWVSTSYFIVVLYFFLLSNLYYLYL